MSDQPQDSWPIPEETQHVAHAAFPKGNLYMRLRDELCELSAGRQWPFEQECVQLPLLFDGET